MINKGLAKRIVPCVFMRFLSERVTADIRTSFFEKTVKMPMKNLELTPNGKILSIFLSDTATIGGGINEITDVDRLLNAGADKISINSAAIRNPNLIDEIAHHYGSQVCVCAIDARLDEDGWYCYVKGGRERTELPLFEWAKEVADRGAGEILFTSMNHDGVKQGFANEALAQLADEVSIPVIASGGAGNMEHFKDVFELGKADAALAASVFHFGEITIPDLKRYLRKEGINVRI